jgi:hypothetical protein
MDHNDSGIARRREWETPGFDPTAQGLPTASLRDAWSEVLSNVICAGSSLARERALGCAHGWTDALLKAQVISLENYKAMRAAAEFAYTQAEQRPTGSVQ